MVHCASTNTFLSRLPAHPFRLIAHNGEDSTPSRQPELMRAREAPLSSDLIPGDLSGCTRFAP